ncbi:unnamed protein product [Polarella glacialis]|uniref:Uncharacterized protein n=1 Tax=Polarella glacialis TaxID=89957 RepID=A0A813LMA6_POLGL|nr:unnamed protein product [Polarella glacialis]
MVASSHARTASSSEGPVPCGGAEAWRRHPGLQRHWRRFWEHPRQAAVLARYWGRADSLSRGDLLRSTCHVGAWVALAPAGSELPVGEDGLSSVQLLARLLRLRGKARLTAWLRGVLHLVALRMEDIASNRLGGVLSEHWLELRRSIPQSVWRKCRETCPPLEATPWPSAQAGSQEEGAQEVGNMDAEVCQVDGEQHKEEMPDEEVWRNILDTTLHANGGILDWRILRDRMIDCYECCYTSADVSREILGSWALSSFPKSYLSSVDAFVRTPPGECQLRDAAACSADAGAKSATALRLFHRDVCRWLNTSAHEQRETWVGGLETQLREALAQHSTSQLRAVFRAAVASLSQPRVRTGGGSGNSMDEAALARLQLKLQRRLRSIVLQVLRSGLLDLLSDVRLLPMLLRLRCLVQGYELRHEERGDICSAASEGQWALLKQFLQADSASKPALQASEEHSATTGQVLEPVCGMQVAEEAASAPAPAGVLAAGSQRSWHRSTTGGTYTPNKRLKALPNVIETDVGVLLCCGTCSQQLISRWVVSHRFDKQFTLRPRGGHRSCGGKYLAPPGVPCKADQITHLEFCPHGTIGRDCRECNKLLLCSHRQVPRLCKTCRRARGTRVLAEEVKKSRSLSTSIIFRVLFAWCHRPPSLC